MFRMMGRLPFKWIAMTTSVDLQQLEHLHAVAASFIGIAIFLLWLLVTNQR